MIETLGPDAGDDVIEARLGLSSVRILDGRLDEAEALLSQLRAELDWDSATWIVRTTWLGNVAQLHRLRGEFEPARDAQAEVLELTRQQYGEVHQQTADTLQNLAVAENELGDLEAGLALLIQARDVYRQLGAGTSIDEARLAFNLGHAAARLGRLDESAQHFGEALSISRELAGDSAQTAKATVGMGSALYKLGRYDEAEAILRESLDLNRRFLPPRGMQSMEAPLWLARTLAKKEQHAESAEHYADLLWRLDGDPGIQPDLLAKYEGEFASELDALGRGDEAEQHRQRQQEILAAAAGANP